jgi:hypothetical protein
VITLVASRGRMQKGRKEKKKKRKILAKNPSLAQTCSAQTE